MQKAAGTPIGKEYADEVGDHVKTLSTRAGELRQQIAHRDRMIELMKGEIEARDRRIADLEAAAAAQKQAVETPKPAAAPNKRPRKR